MVSVRGGGVVGDGVAAGKSKFNAISGIAHVLVLHDHIDAIGKNDLSCSRRYGA